MGGEGFDPPPFLRTGRRRFQPCDVAANLNISAVAVLDRRGWPVPPAGKTREDLLNFIHNSEVADGTAMGGSLKR
jgi:hypothetical protein